MENYFPKNISVIAIILIYCLASSFCKQQNADVQCTPGDDCWNQDSEARVLSRRKRALTFPEGSSLQLGMT
jgi:hypothetical protein